MSKLQAGILYEDKLEGLSNYSPWKERIKFILHVNKIWEFFEKEIKKPTEPREMEVYENLDTRVRLIILDGVKDPLIPYFFGKKIANEMWMALQNLFQNKKEKHVLVLEDKLKSTKVI